LIGAVVGSLVVGIVLTPACGGTKSSSGFGGDPSGSSSGGNGSSGGNSGSGNNGSSSGSGGGTGSGFGSTSSSGTSVPVGDGGVACPPGLQCNVSCSGGVSTTITGKVYDPAGKNPLYNVAVYVPATPLQPLPKGVPTGGDACSCAALFKSGALTSTVTGVDGSFTLTNVPVGSSVPLVLQIGKWRRSLQVNVASCQNNGQPDKSLTLPGTVANPDDNMPDIAVSTGYADTLECLMKRIGLPESEYVAGAGGSGHIHVFAGGQTFQITFPPMPPGPGGMAEQPGMAGAPPSYQSLWDKVDDLMPYDITLLSCEGAETYNANPAALEQYLNAGGRAFASHFHYAWFGGPINTMQSYSAPADWGNNLATWSYDLGMDDNSAIGGAVVQTLNGYSQPFAKGVALQQWLMNVGALGQSGVPANDLSIYQPRYNAVVAPANKASQPWITSDTGMAGQTMYFSFDTPVNNNPPPPGPDPSGGPAYCGRAVFSDLHVGGDPATMDSMQPPSGCSATDLSPQEKALEFMLFDLSSCVIPDNVTPPVVVPPLPQ
jgi:hypothetical protein